MGCVISNEVTPSPDDEFPQGGRKLRRDATVEEVYELGNELGTGGFSKVWLATHRETGEQYACKIIPLPRVGHHYNEHMATRADIMCEIDAILGLEHSAVCWIHEYFVWHNHAYLILELLRGGDLLDALTLAPEGRYSEGDARTIFQQLVEGVAYMHSMGVVHRDLKLDNLLLARKGDISSLKIVDFGLAKKRRRVDVGPQPLKTICGTPQYLAPEVLRCRAEAQQCGGCGCCGYAGPAVDMWACGVILYMLLSGAAPFADAHQPTVLFSIAHAQYDVDGPVWASISGGAKDLLARLLVADPKARLGSADVLEHPWLCAGAPCDGRPLPHAEAVTRRTADAA